MESEKKPKKRKSRATGEGKEKKEGKKKASGAAAGGDKKQNIKAADNLLEPPPDSSHVIDTQNMTEEQKQQVLLQQQQQQDYDMEDDDMVELDPEYEKYLRGRNEEAVQQMRILMEKMTPEQQTRYETYRSAAFPKAAIKKIMQQALGQNIPERMAIMIAGVAKLHLGQLVESAMDVMEETGEKGPIRPDHLREADRRISSKKVAFF